MPSGGTVHQKAALQVTEGPHQLLELLLGESAGQVGNAQQSICGLQLHRDLPVPQHMLVELFDGTLRLFPIEQCHKRCGWWGDSKRDKHNLVSSEGVTFVQPALTARSFFIHSRSQGANCDCDTISALGGLIKDNAGGTMSPHTSFHVTATFPLLKVQWLSQWRTSLKGTLSDYHCWWLKSHLYDL